MSANKKRTERLDQIEDDIRRRYREFWDSFSIQELEAIANDNASPELMAKIEANENLFALHDAIMTPEERAEREKIMAELNQK